MSEVRFDNNTDFIRWNEAMSRKYDSEDYHLRSNRLIRWIESRRVQAVLAFLDAGSGDCVMEIGCGAGVVLEQIPAGKLLGLDLSSTILPKARRRLRHRGASLLQANAEQLPFASNQFDKLVCTELLEHTLEPGNVIREMARVATAGALIVITVPNESLIERVKGVITKLGLGRWLLQGTSVPRTAVPRTAVNTQQLAYDAIVHSPDSFPRSTWECRPNALRSARRGASNTSFHAERGTRENTQQLAYHSPHGSNEWHIHHFDLTLLQELLEDRLEIRQLKAIPFSWLPLRYVVCCQVNSVWHGQETGHSDVETGHSDVETGHSDVEVGHSLRNDET